MYTLFIDLDECIVAYVCKLVLFILWLHACLWHVYAHRHHIILHSHTHTHSKTPANLTKKIFSVIYHYTCKRMKVLSIASYTENCSCSPTQRLLENSSCKEFLGMHNVHQFYFQRWWYCYICIACIVKCDHVNAFGLQMLHGKDLSCYLHYSRDFKS